MPDSVRNGRDGAPSPACSPASSTPSANSGARSWARAQAGGVIVRVPAAHSARSSLTSAVRRRSIAERIRVLAVPSGMPSCSATSRPLNPSRPDKHDRSLLFDGEVGERRAEPIDVVVHHGGVGRFVARRRQGEREQRLGIDGQGPSHADRIDREVAGDREQPRRHAPRRASYVAPCRHARSSASWATSSARRRSPVIVTREAEDPALEPGDEGRRRFGVAGRHAGQERIVGDRPHDGIRAGNPSGLPRPPSVDTLPADGGRRDRAIRSAPSCLLARTPVGPSPCRMTPTRPE